MSYNVSQLGDYTKENADLLLANVVSKGVTIDRIKAKGNIRPDIKSAEAIGIIETDAVFQDGSDCGFNASGTTTISQRKIEVAEIKVNEAFCQKDLNKKFTQLALPKGSTYDTLAFEQDIVEGKTNTINFQNEKAVWRGDKNSGVHYLNKFDGFLKQMFADPTTKAFNIRVGKGTISATNSDPTVTGIGTEFTKWVAIGDKVYSGTTLLGTVDSVTNDTSLELAANAAATVSGTIWASVPSDSLFFTSPKTAATDKSNILALIDDLYLMIPEDSVFAPDQSPVFYMGVDDAKALKVAMKNANLYHYPANMKVDDLASFIIPGIELECQPTPGLSKTGYIVVTRDKNLFLGTDMEDEENKVDLWYNKDEQEMRLNINWKMGVQYAFGKEIAIYRRLAVSGGAYV